MLSALRAAAIMFIAATTFACGPEFDPGSTESFDAVVDGAVPEAPEENTVLAPRPDPAEAGRRCGWLCCTKQHMACNARNASVDRDYIMEPCDLDLAICTDGLPL